MRVACWAPTFAPDIGGIEVLLSRLLPALHARGHEFLVITTDTGVGNPYQRDAPGITVRRFPFTTALARRDVRQIAGIQRDVIAAMAAFRPELSHIHHAGAIAFFQLATSHAWPVPSVMTVHTPCDDQNAGDDTVFARSLRAATRVTAVSAATLADVLARVPDVADRASVIHNGVPMPRIQAAPTPAEGLHVVFVGRLVHEKGADVAVRAFARVRGTLADARLTIAGDGPERAALEHLARDEGVADAVTFTGAVAPDDVPALMNTASVILVPSRYREPFGLVAVEAALLGRPVIASRTGGLVEVIDDGVTGRLVPVEDAAALGEALLALAASGRAIATRMGEVGRTRALALFSLDACADAYDHLYRTL